MRPIPKSLRIVAYLFIAGGVSSVVHILVGLITGKVNLDFGVCFIFVGMGLLHTKRSSWKWAMFWTWFGLIGAPIILVLSAFNPGQLTLFGISSGPAPPGLGFIMAAIGFALVCWQYSVLTNSEVRNLF